MNFSRLVLSESAFSNILSLYSIFLDIRVLFLLYIIRIYHECEGRIEKFVPRIAVWRHKACRVMTNGEPRQIIPSYPHMNNGFFFLLSTVLIYLFILKKASRSP